MTNPSEMRVKLARFVEERRVCTSCLGGADRIAIEGESVSWGEVITVSEKLGFENFIEHSSCEKWIRLSWWLFGVLDASYVPWDEMRAEIKRRVDLYVEDEDQWRNILLLMEEEMVHMTREVIWWDRHKQHVWEEKWRDEMV